MATVEKRKKKASGVDRMHYNSIEYSLAQTIAPSGWRWSFQYLDHDFSGANRTRHEAVRAAHAPSITSFSWSSPFTSETFVNSKRFALERSQWAPSQHKLKAHRGLDKKRSLNPSGSGRKPQALAHVLNRVRQSVLDSWCPA